MDVNLVRDALSGNYVKPNIFLCEVDKTKICRLETTDTKLSLKFNSYSEISFEVASIYNDVVTGETKPFPYYDKVEALRLIYVEHIGYFEIQSAPLQSDGIKESKTVTAYSLEYTLSQKYLENLYNDGTVGSVEAGYIDEKYGGTLPEGVEYPVITLYNPKEPKLSLLHIILEKAYGWEIGDIDVSLKDKSRQFNIDRTSIYDFIMNDICEMFNCYAVFDTMENKINLYAEALTKRFKCDGNTKRFIISPPYQEIGTISDDGYKMTNDRYEYNPITGELILNDAPADGHTLEVISEDMTPWETDVLVSFDNLSQEINVDYSADDIKTVLTVEYGEGQNIREVNLGLPYITDLSYYYSVDWMGQELYDVYTEYNKACEEIKETYTTNVQNRLELASDLDYEENRTSLTYGLVHNISHETIGTYYVRTGDAPNYTYVEKTLPEDYKAGTTYFKNDGINLTETNIVNFRKALGHYFLNDSMEELDKLVEEFQFTNDNILPFAGVNYEQGQSYKQNTLLYILDKHKELGALKSNDKDVSPEDKYEGIDIYSDDAQERDVAIKQFLVEIFDQFGTNLLEVIRNMYLKAQEGFIEAWKKSQDANIEVEEDTGNDNDDELTDEDREQIEQELKDSAEDYPNYYPIVLILEALNQEIGTSKHSTPPSSESTGRYEIIDPLKDDINTLISKNASITESLVMDTWFFNYYYNSLEAEWKKENNKSEDYKLTNEEKHKLEQMAKPLANGLLMRLSPFLREDELVLDDIVSTELDTIVESLSVQEDALSAGYLELQKLSQPQLKFSMTMANIYALPEFFPIVKQFKLGNLIKVAIRPDYIKQSRLMQVDMGLDDFSDFSCQFSELTSLRSQSDIHADLLGQAVSAGKQVATYSSYWTKGSDMATTTDLKIQQGLLDATTQIKAIDGTQDVVIDKYGIKLQKKNSETGELDPRQARFVNNMLLFTNDNWKTSTTGLGEFTVDEKTFYGLIADAVLAGYIEGSDIVGGTLKIGDLGNDKWALEIDKDGNISMLDGYIKFSGGDNGVNTLKDTMDGLQHTAAIKFLKESNFIGLNDPFVIAYVSLYKNNQEIDALPTKKYHYSESNKIEEDGSIYTDHEDESELIKTYIEVSVDAKTSGIYYTRDGEDPDYIYTEVSLPDDYNENVQYYNIATLSRYFVCKTGDDYSITLGEYDFNLNKWMAVKNLQEYSYFNNLYEDVNSKIIVITKEDINDSREIIFSVYNTSLDDNGKQIYNDELLVAKTDTIVVNLNDELGEVVGVAKNVKDYMEFNPEYGLRISQKNDNGDIPFFVNIDSEEMGFYQDNDRVVYISGNKASITDLTVEKSADFNCKISLDKQIDIYNTDSDYKENSPGFSFQVEPDGSFSLVKMEVN